MHTGIYQIQYNYLGISSIKEEIKRFGNTYRVKIRAHPNELASTLYTWNDTDSPRRLRRHHAVDLNNRFN